MPKSRWHPSRTSGRQKLIRQIDTNKLNKKPSKKKLEEINLSKSDWSTKRGEI